MDWLSKSRLSPWGSQHNPVAAAIKADKNGGDVMNAILDPSGLLLKQPLTAEESEARVKNQAMKKKKAAYARAGKPYPGYKKGGQVKGVKKMKSGGKTKLTCRGMGKATKGGQYNG